MNEINKTALEHTFKTIADSMIQSLNIIQDKIGRCEELDNYERDLLCIFIKAMIE